MSDQEHFNWPTHNRVGSGRTRSAALRMAALRVQDTGEMLFVWDCFNGKWSVEPTPPMYGPFVIVNPENAQSFLG